MLRWAQYGLAVLALACLAHGFYIPAKAQLAQWLLDASWNDRAPNSRPVPPWHWADTSVLALLEVPRLDIRQYVMDSDSGQSLAFGPGYMPGTTYPAHPGHSMIAGHRDTHFAFLQQLKRGDTIDIEHYQGLKARYRVEQISIIDSSIERMPIYASDMLSLITCYPFDEMTAGGPLRYVVHAVKIDR